MAKIGSWRVRTVWACLNCALPERFYNSDTLMTSSHCLSWWLPTDFYWPLLTPNWLLLGTFEAHDGWWTGLQLYLRPLAPLIDIHCKSEKIGRVYSWAQKNWRKKCVNGDDKNSRQEYVNHEIYDKIAYLLKNMILVFVYLRSKQLLKRVGRK